VSAIFGGYVETAKQIVRIGCDPELFVRRAGAEIIPVCGLIGGSKDFPKPLPAATLLEGDIGAYAVQEDGVALEFNTPAFQRADSFVLGIGHALKECKRMARARKLELVTSPYHSFDAKALEDPRACVLGCLPDNDAYSEVPGAAREPFRIEQLGTNRFCGGHLHLGYDKTKVPVHVMARFMDLFIGLPSIHKDKQGPRRGYYGKAGLYREKDYGIEYRTLSNYWLRDAQNPDSPHLHYLAQSVIDLGLMASSHPERLAKAYEEIPWDDVREAIATENTTVAYEIYSYCTAVLRLPMRYWLELATGRNKGGKE
jgi:hypothetical protein